MIDTGNMVALFAAISLGIAALESANAGESKVAKIVEIDSRDALDAMEPTLKLDGWDVRIAMAPGTVPAKPGMKEAGIDFRTSPWRILYADYRRIKKGAEFPRMGVILGGEPIGHLEYEVEYEPGGDFDDGGLRRKEERLMEKMQMLRKDSDHYLIAATIPTPGKGAYRIRVYETIPEPIKPGFDGERNDPLTEAVWKQDAEIPCQWVEFVTSRWVDDPVHGVIPYPDQMVKRFVPAAPDFGGIRSLVRPDKVGKNKRETEKRNPIVGMVPAAPDPGFRISRSGSGIVIRLENPGSNLIDNFLVRWWVDDIPVALTFEGRPGAEEEEERLQGSPVDVVDGEAFTTRVPFQTPLLLNGAKKTSKIGIQLLYSPIGNKRIPNPHVEPMKEMKEALEYRMSYDLRLSNKLEFKLGDIVVSK